MGNFERARKVMVDTQLRPASITDTRLLSAMGIVPREKFIPTDRQSIAYVDTTHVLDDNGRELASAASFAKLVQLGEITEDAVVLDVGCGTGYSTAILASLASAVVGIDTSTQLVDTANANLADLDIGNAAVLEAPLAAGVPSEAPFDVILLEGAVEEVPAALINQLKDGGRLVAMIAAGVTLTATVFLKTGKNVTTRSAFSATLPKLNSLRKEPVFSL